MAKLQLLSTREVQAAGDGDHSDGGGLLLRVRGASSSWVFRFTAPSGRRREMGLGVAFRNTTKAAGESLTTAREAARQARDLLVRGVDPIDARDQRREQERQADQAKRAEKEVTRWTLARCARDYHERVIERSRTPKHAAQWIASLENHVPPSIWRAPIGSVEPPDLLRALLMIKPHERARNLTSSQLQETRSRLRQRLDAVFEDAMFHKRCSNNPAAAIRRKLSEAEGRRPRGAFRALPYREAPAFMAKLRAAEGTAARALEFAVVTVARTAEVLEAAWDEFDLQAATWTVPAERMKAGEPHVVYLSRSAMNVLQLQRGQDPRLVFPSPATKPGQAARPLSNMAMLSVLDRLGARGDTTVHGLCRASFSTWSNECGVARADVIEACLAHAEQDKVRKAYNRAKFADERRALMVAWADFLARPAADVVPLRAA